MAAGTALTTLPCPCHPPPQLYPYHLADYVSRVMRVTPFRYYNEVLLAILKEEKSYDRIPNFTVGNSMGGGGSRLHCPAHVAQA
jgi:hypothetical protein